MGWDCPVPSMPVHRLRGVSLVLSAYLCSM